MIAPQLEALSHNLSLVQQWIGHVSHTDFLDRLNSSDVAFEQTADAVGLSTYQQFAETGNEVEIRLESRGWRGRLLASDGPAFSIERTGPYEDAFGDDEAIEAAITAVETQDAGRLLRLWSGRTVKVRVTLRNWPQRSGFHWCRSTSAFVATLSSPAWLTATSQIWGVNGSRRLVLQDAGEAVLVTPGAVVHGPESYPNTVTLADQEQPEAYRRMRLLDQRKEVPAPPQVMPVSSPAGDQLSPVLIGVAGQLVWCWLAREVQVDSDGMVVRFEGARVVEFRLTVRPLASLEPALELWRWAVSSTDPAQFEALQQAVSLAVSGPSDLAAAARPALRTARTLYELARRGAVAEAMATRRSAREAAVHAASDSANAATAAAAKTFDRVVVQVVAIAGILIAQANNLIKPDVTRNLLVLVAALIFALGFLVFTVDFPGARAMLKAFADDLKEYRDTLSDDDLAAVRHLQSIAKAKEAIRRAQVGTGLLLVVAFIFALVVRSKIT